MYLFVITYLIVKSIQTSRKQLSYYLEFVKFGLWFQGQAFPKNDLESCALKNNGEVLRRQVFSQRYRATCQETWILSTTSVRSSNPARLKSLHQHAYSRVLRHEMQSCTNGTKGHSAFFTRGSLSKFRNRAYISKHVGWKWSQRMTNIYNLAFQHSRSSS